MKTDTEKLAIWDSRQVATLIAEVNHGLTVWPSSNTAVCVINREAYMTYIVVKRIGGSASLSELDDELITEMTRLLLAEKKRVGAKYVSWRKQPEFYTDDGDYELDANLAKAVSNEQRFDRRVVLDLDQRRRKLRCRVLITANTGDVEAGEEIVCRTDQA